MRYGGWRSGLRRHTIWRSWMWSLAAAGRAGRCGFLWRRTRQSGSGWRSGLRRGGVATWRKRGPGGWVPGGRMKVALRFFVEKDAAERKRLAERVAAGEVDDLPKRVPVELLSGVTHEDCAAFATDFGTLLDRSEKRRVGKECRSR